MAKYFINDTLIWDIQDGCLMDRAIQSMLKEERAKRSKAIIEGRYGSIPTIKESKELLRALQSEV